MAIPTGTGGSGPKPNKPAGSSAPFYIQPPFDIRIYHTQFPLFGLASGGKLQRGFMQWKSPIAGYSQNAKVSFLFNPSTVTAAYTMATGYSDPADAQATLMFRDAADPGIPRFPLSQSISFALLYDRTYELWGGYNTDGTPVAGGSTAEINNPHVNGVNVDILAMKQFTGMLSSLPAGVGNSKNFAEHQQGPMLFVPCWFYLGLADGLDYYGFITDWQVQITHWTQYMVPMRCVINVDMTLLPSPTATASTKASNIKPWMKVPASNPAPNTRIQASASSSGKAGR